ncbi:hypothetical protein CR513_57151, partial [Mucuna pruriens]
MKRMFLEKFFPAFRTTSIRKEICDIMQHSGDTRQFGVKGSIASIVVNEVVATNNQRLENKITKLTSLVK